MPKRRCIILGSQCYQQFGLRWSPEDGSILTQYSPSPPQTLEDPVAEEDYKTEVMIKNWTKLGFETCCFLLRSQCAATAVDALK